MAACGAFRREGGWDCPQFIIIDVAIAKLTLLTL